MTPDELNTWRTLRDQLPVVTSWQCRFGVHTWTKWGQPYTSGYKYYQLKECIHCNSKRNKEIDRVSVAGCNLSN